MIRIWKIIVLFIAILIVLSGCAVHKPRVPDLSQELPGSFPSARIVAEANYFPQHWWKTFQDPRLDALMEELFARNFDVTQAYERFTQTRAVSASVSAAQLPSLSLGGSAGRVRQLGITGTVTSESYKLSAEAGYEIDLWQKIQSRIAAAKLDTMASYQDLQSLYISLSAQLADLYYLAAEQQAQLELADRAIASYLDTWELVQFRYREGLVPSVDVYQAQQNLSAVRSQRPALVSALAAARNGASVLIGRFPERTGEAHTRVLPDIGEWSAGAPAALLVQRPDIQAALLRLRAADERIGAAIADQFPSFNLIGSYGGASNDLKTLLSSPNIFWNLLAGIAQPLFDGGRRRAEVTRTEALYREGLSRYHQTVLRAFQEVEDALSRGEATKERIVLLEQRLALANESHRLGLDRYRQGLTDYLPVLVSQQRLYEVESALLSARRQRVSDHIQLARSLGGTWTEKVIRERFVPDKGSHVKDEPKK